LGSCVHTRLRAGQSDAGSNEFVCVHTNIAIVVTTVELISCPTRPQARIVAAAATAITVADLFMNQVLASGTLPALQEGERSCSYRELNARVNRLANALRTRGVRREDRMLSPGPGRRHRGQPRLSLSVDQFKHVAAPGVTVIHADYLGMPVGLNDREVENACYFACCAAGEFRLQCCTACGRRRNPPSPSCPWCAEPQSQAAAWRHPETRRAG
jgi:hypothetical protein